MTITDLLLFLGECDGRHLDGSLPIVMVIKHPNRDTHHYVTTLRYNADPDVGPVAFYLTDL